MYFLAAVTQYATLAGGVTAARIVGVSRPSGLSIRSGYGRHTQAHGSSSSGRHTSNVRGDRQGRGQRGVQQHGYNR